MENVNHLPGLLLKLLRHKYVVQAHSQNVYGFLVTITRGGKTGKNFRQTPHRKVARYQPLKLVAKFVLVVVLASGIHVGNMRDEVDVVGNIRSRDLTLGTGGGTEVYVYKGQELEVGISDLDITIDNCTDLDIRVEIYIIGNDRARVDLLVELRKGFVVE